MKYIFISISIIFLSFKISAQCEEPQAFQLFNQSTNKVEDAWDWNDPDVVYWGFFTQFFGLHVAYFDMTTLPANLLNNQTEISNQTLDCINQWNNGGCLNLYYDDNYPYVRLEFSDQADLFPTPTAYGGTLFNISGSVYDGWQFEYNGGSYGSSQTRILLNKTSAFLQLYTWSVSTSNPGTPYVPFKPILLHEFGHLIGLGHNGSNGSYVMSITFVYNQFLFDLTNCDIHWRSELCLFNGQNPASSLTINPFRNNLHYFYDFNPELVFQY